jgi:hypothetical protein
MQFHYFSKKFVLETVVFLLIFIHTSPTDYGHLEGKMGNSGGAEIDSQRGRLIGTSYYYDSKSNYTRYSVKGYFDDRIMT